MKSITITLPTIGDVELVRTLDAFITLPSEFDGFVGLLQRVDRFDVAACAKIISLGCGQIVSEQAVFDAGVLNLRTDLIAYLDLLAGGPVVDLIEGVRA